jgi:hypothetical protein
VEQHTSPASLPAFTRFRFHGPAVDTATETGFRFGDKGTHTSRTLMLAELSAVLAAVPTTGSRPDYLEAVIEANCLAKPTTSTRRLTLQRLSELYALDPTVPLFRVLRRLWDLDADSHPLLAILAALARDPLLIATAPAILTLPNEVEMIRPELRQAIRSAVGERLSEATMDKVVRNAASSWTQSGHLAGRTFKKRKRVRATACALAFALYLGDATGLRGDELLSSGWVKVLGCSKSDALDLALEAKRLGILDLRVSGEVFDLNLNRLDPNSKESMR